MVNCLIIVRDLILKHLKGPRISKKNNFKIKKYSDVNTENICNYIKPSIVNTPDFSVVHSGTNDLTNRISTMTKILKVLATAEQMDKDRKTNLGFSAFIDQGYVEKVDEIVAVNDSLQK